MNEYEGRVCALRGPMTFTWQPWPVADPLSHVTLEHAT